MKKTGILTVLCLMALLCGCSSKSKYTCRVVRRRVTIQTEPPGAIVTQLRPLGEASLDLGVTPIVDRPVWVMSKITLNRHISKSEAQEVLDHLGTLVVLIEKDGYEPYRAAYAILPDKPESKTSPGKPYEYSVKLIPIAK